MSLITLLLPDLRCGGAEQVCIQLAKEFTNKGYSVEFLLCSLRGELLETASSIASVRSLKVSRFREVLLPLSRYISLHQPDVLLASMWPLTCLAPLSKRISQSRTKVIISEHVTLENQYKDWGVLTYTGLGLSTAIGYRLADQCIAVSRGVAQSMSQLAHFPLDRITVIYNSRRTFPEPTESELEQIEQLWNTPRGHRIVTVGTLKEQKNHALLLQAFAQLPFVNHRLMLVGTGHLEDNLKALAHQLGIADRVVFAGFYQNPAAFYKTADLFVLSSDYEGLPSVLIEALSYGLPVVSTDCPSGPREILIDGKYGRLVPVGNSSALAQAITETLMNPPEPEFPKQRAADFSAEKIAQQYLDLMFSNGY
ncbi:glycosyltransferase [Thermosynechococcus sp. HN-54]|uniref:glycosyltransferase n=1 Tax=Thermosynechococcus sp. HN-54 TaxID=2933959 RepID=UPI00202CBBFD|nr:glycosyltransferase [Thermosynechococcus sp. HN-54]URR35481.1 glycosyltransferase [Thermosynechococcus sp. HN-54]